MQRSPDVHLAFSVGRCSTRSLRRRGHRTSTGRSLIHTLYFRCSKTYKIRCETRHEVKSLALFPSSSSRWKRYLRTRFLPFSEAKMSEPDLKASTTFVLITVIVKATTYTALYDQRVEMFQHPIVPRFSFSNSRIKQPPSSPISKQPE